MNEKTMMHYTAIVAIIGLALLNGATLYYAFSRPLVPLVTTREDTQINVISVTGTGYAYAAPDMAYVSVTVLTESETATEAQQKNAELMKSVIEALRKIGVSMEDLRTEQYALSPVYDREGRKIVGYACRNTLRVTWRKVDQVGTVLDTAVKAGANTVGSVTFGLSRQKVEALTTQAIREAASDAEAKAQTLASALKLTIVGKVSASIGAPYVPQTRVYELKAEATPIIPGELQVSVTVNVTYRFA
jgi:hypothetical protein